MFGCFKSRIFFLDINEHAILLCLNIIALRRFSARLQLRPWNCGGYSSFSGKRAMPEDLYDIKLSIIDGYGSSRDAEEHLFTNLMKHREFMTDTNLAISETYYWKIHSDLLDAESSTHRDDVSTASTTVLMCKSFLFGEKWPTWKEACAVVLHLEEERASMLSSFIRRREQGACSIKFRFHKNFAAAMERMGVDIVQDLRGTG